MANENLFTTKILNVKSKMTFAAFEGKTGALLSHMELIGIIRGFID